MAARPTLKQRARSVPFKRDLVRALIITAVFYAAVVGLLTSVAIYLLEPKAHSGILFVGLMALTLGCWLFSYLARRKAKCMLCHGTPFLDSGAHVHAKAWKFPGVNYGNSNAMRSLFTLHYRCMYCGTLYDFLKPVTNPLPGSGKKKKHPKEPPLKKRTHAGGSSSLPRG